MSVLGGALGDAGGGLAPSSGGAMTTIDETELEGLRQQNSDLDTEVRLS